MVVAGDTTRTGKDVNEKESLRKKSGFWNIRREEEI